MLTAREHHAVVKRRTIKGKKTEAAKQPEPDEPSARRSKRFTADFSRTIATSSFRARRLTERLRWPRWRS